MQEVDSLLSHKDRLLKARISTCCDDIHLYEGVINKNKTYQSRKRKIIIFSLVFIHIIILFIIFGFLFPHIYIPYNDILNESIKEINKIQKQLNLTITQINNDAKWWSFKTNVITPWEDAFLIENIMYQGTYNSCNDLCVLNTMFNIDPCSIYIESCVYKYGYCNNLQNQWCVEWQANDGDDVIKHINYLIQTRNTYIEQIIEINRSIENGFIGKRLNNKWFIIFISICIFILISMILSFVLLSIYFINKEKKEPNLYNYQTYQDLDYTLERCQIIEYEKITEVKELILNYNDNINYIWKKRIAFLGGRKRPESTIFQFLNSPASKDIKPIILKLANLGPNQIFFEIC